MIPGLIVFAVLIALILWVRAKTKPPPINPRHADPPPSKTRPKRAHISPLVIHVARHDWPARGEYDFKIVGAVHYQESMRVLAGAHGDENAQAVHTACLTPEDANPHDNKAVRVDINGLHVGYLAREDARSFRRRLGQKKLKGAATTCSALIAGGFILKDGTRAHYGVRLDIEPFN